jgi:hypothetical protein
VAAVLAALTVEALTEFQTPVVVVVVEVQTNLIDLGMDFLVEWEVRV